MELQEWIDAHRIPDGMVFRDGASAQFQRWICLARWWRGATNDATVRVLGEHKSKSIALPLVEYAAQSSGLRVIARDNFYNLAITVESKHPLRFAPHPSWAVDDVDQMSSCYFEGFDRAGVPVYGRHIDDPRRFSFHLWGAPFAFGEALDALLLAAIEAQRAEARAIAHEMAATT